MARLQDSGASPSITPHMAAESFGSRVVRDFQRNKTVYLMLLPIVVYYLIFHYGPMYGVQIAFKDYTPMKGFTKSPWTGFNHFTDFFNGFYFWRLLRNTVLLSLYSLIFVFPAGIILALLLNEIRSNKFKRVVQSITYMPHFISLVVIVGMMFDFLERTGLINNMLVFLFGMKPIAFMQSPSWFRTLYISSDIWQNVGWSSIIYLAALSNIDPTLYEAAKMDGANRWKMNLHITIPGIMSTVVIMLILFIGHFMTVGLEKILLMYNALTYETADVIQTYVYRQGILEADYSYSAAVGMFNSVISFILLLSANTIARKTGGSSLW